MQALINQNLNSSKQEIKIDEIYKRKDEQIKNIPLNAGISKVNSIFHQDNTYFKIPKY